MLKRWAKVIHLEKGIVLFTVRRDDNDLSKARIMVEMDTGSFLEGCDDFGVASMTLADVNFDNLEEGFLDSFADAQRAKDAVKMMIISWEQVRTMEPIH